MKRTKFIAVTVAMLVVIGALSWLGITLQKGRPVAVQQQVFAPTGQLVTGFPKELVLDQVAQISGSYAVNYSPTLDQYTANWTSTSSINDLYGEYVDYFISRGWAITNTSTDIAGFRGIYAVTSTADVNVVMNDSGQSGLSATVSYVKE